MANENMIKFLRGNVANLPQTATAGALYFTKDEGIYMGMEDGSYHRYGDFIIVANIDALPASGAHATCMYYCTEQNILCRYDSANSKWVQINKQPDAETLKTLLGLGTLAYKSEVAEGDLNEDLKAKIDASSAANHSHANKDELDLIATGDVAKWNAAEQNAKDYADDLDEAMNTRVEALEAVDHEHANKALLDTYTQTEENLADAVAKKHEHTNKDVLDGITAEKVTAWDAAEGNAKSYADGLASGIKNDIIGELADGKTVVDIVGEAVYDDTQVKADIKANADAIAAINNADTGLLKQAKDYADGKDEAIAAAKKAGDDAAAALAAHATEAGNTYETKTDASAKLAEAKKYTDDKIAEIPAQTDYSVTITENTDDATVAKTYVFTQCGEEIGSIKLAKELVVTSGSVKEVETADAPYAGAKVGEKYIELVIANQDAPIYVPAKDLVDIYTAKDGAAEVQIAISNTNEISATLVNGGITEEKLADGVKTKLNKVWEEVGVAQGLVNGLANGQVKTNKEAIENITKADGLIAAAEQRAKDYADGLAGNYAEAEHDHVAADITDFESAVATKVESYGYATTGYADQAEADAKAYADAEVAKDRERLDVLEAIDHDAYKAADTTLKGEIIGTAEDASTADTINGTKKYADEKVAAAKTEAANQDAVVLAEAQAYADQSQSDAEAKAAELDAALKSELQGEIDDDVKVVSDALAQYKTDNDAVVALKANAADVYIKAEVEALMTWGEF